jgi:heme/copper-type cytochrome/quinol oxidase subunit 2
VQGGGVTTQATGFNPNDLQTVALQQQAQQRQQITNLVTYAIIGVVLVVVIVLVFRLTKTAK